MASSPVGSFKYLLNAVDSCVDENLSGQVCVHPGQRILAGEPRVIIRADIEQKVIGQGKVSVLCGGGAGHEPAHAGYVGQGMLSASVSGSIFTSPPPASIFAAIKAISKPHSAGVLVIIKNYTGDRLNFSASIERARNAGYKVESVVVADCCMSGKQEKSGRRGLCGTILVHKIAGALAEEGKSLQEITAICKEAVRQMGTIGLGLSACNIPGSGPLFTLAPDEMELGLGIHGEAGVKRMKLVSANEAVAIMVDHMTDSENQNRFALHNGDEIGVVINNLGSLTVLEMNVVAKETIIYLERKGAKVSRAYCGSFITSLNMRGFSITLLHLNDTFKRCLDAPTNAPSWLCPYLPAGLVDRQTLLYQENGIMSLQSEKKTYEVNNILMFKSLENVCKWLKMAEVDLNYLDTGSGDGDCGTTLARGAQAINNKLNTIEACGLPVDQPAALLRRLAEIVEQEMGGSSGALYSVFLNSAAKVLSERSSAITFQVWCQAYSAGLHGIMKYGGAKPGDRTMVDPLSRIEEIFKEKNVFQRNLNLKEKIDIFTLAVEAAEETTESTKDMKAKAGRASYVSSDLLTKPDPGAVGTTLWLRAILEAIHEEQ